jgi:hypothetical protein
MSADRSINDSDFYLESYAKKMGIRTNGFKSYKLSIKYHGVHITLYRCHCHVVKLTGKYVPESLFLDPAGNILLCMRDNRKIDLLDDIKKRESDFIIKTLKNINFETICPLTRLR